MSKGQDTNSTSSGQAMNKEPRKPLVKLLEWLLNNRFYPSCCKLLGKKFQPIGLIHQFGLGVSHCFIAARTEVGNTSTTQQHSITTQSLIYFLESRGKDAHLPVDDRLRNNAQVWHISQPHLMQRSQSAISQSQPYQIKSCRSSFLVDIIHRATQRLHGRIILNWLSHLSCYICFELIQLFWRNIHHLLIINCFRLSQNSLGGRHETAYFCADRL